MSLPPVHRVPLLRPKPLCVFVVNHAMLCPCRRHQASVSILSGAPLIARGTGSNLQIHNMAPAHQQHWFHRNRKPINSRSERVTNSLQDCAAPSARVVQGGARCLRTRFSTLRSTSTISTSTGWPALVSRPSDGFGCDQRCCRITYADVAGCRHVVLPSDIAALLPKGRLLTEVGESS